MLLTVGELRARVAADLPSLVAELADLTGRGGPSERHAWERSLPRLCDALTTPELGRVHVHFARREHHAALEYQLPGASAWCDVVLLGRHRDRPSAVIVELKDWETSSDRPGVAEGLIERRGSQELHPSDQVRGYVEYCRRFHSAVLEHRAAVHGFVLLTTGLLKHPYFVPPNERLATEFPLFSMSQDDVGVELPSYLAARITEQDESFATQFAVGTYRQDRGFMQQIGRLILDGDVRHFELLDNQRRALHLCETKARDAMSTAPDRKHVIIVEGPPGSGKSAVAARLWANLVADEAVPEGNVVLVTTSQSQSSNWTYLIDKVSRSRAARGVARKATSFSPIDTQQLGRIRRATGRSSLYRDAADWREHLRDLAQRGIQPKKGAEDDACLFALVDEAHALINPEREHGVGQFGFVTGLGPQAFHIIRCSRLAVFFLDPDQSFRARENTSVSDIEGWARELGAVVERVSLQGVQFRCAGSAEYVAWVDSLLSGGSEELNRVYASAWHRPAGDGAFGRSGSNNVIAIPVRLGTSGQSSGLLAAAEATTGSSFGVGVTARPGMDFRILANPFEMERELRRRADGRHTVRLVSTYSRPWKTEGSTYPHRLPPDALDFREVVEMPDGERRIWSRPWNFVPGQDYTGFVAGRPGLPIHDDPLCEVGCTYAVRGFDFDYLGLLWLDDLVWRDGQWKVQLENVHESGIGVMVRQALREGAVAPAGPRGANVVEKVRQAYRILLTRAIRGVFVWIPDAETRSHVAASLGVAMGRRWSSSD
ncbi:MAG TPA: DNA/RNA helicase domain-containing protein [Zeimonas sp.]|nr:DNA/RNA helicase domain-containing protein [Zeimonas sp.]